MANLKKQMLTLWIAGMCGIIVLTFSVFAIVLGVQRVQFGLDLDVAYLNTIDIRNKPRTSDSEVFYVDHNHPTSMLVRNSVLYFLKNGGQTNRLSQLFQPGNRDIKGHPSRNITGVRNTLMVQTQSSHQYIAISWRIPQFAIITQGGNISIEKSPNRTFNGNIHQIYIMLNDIPDRFTEQIWYLVTSDPGSSNNINYTFTTWGNYSRLADFVRTFTNT